jgi:hypothetical protein
MAVLRVPASQSGSSSRMERDKNQNTQFGPSVPSRLHLGTPETGVTTELT